jgi:hypothetical protein
MALTLIETAGSTETDTTPETTTLRLTPVTDTTPTEANTGLTDVL